MGQEESFQNINNIHRINNNNYKKNSYIEYSSNKDIIKPNKSMFEFLYVIGRGGFGKVWMVKYKKTNEKYANTNEKNNHSKTIYNPKSTS